MNQAPSKIDEVAFTTRLSEWIRGVGRAIPRISRSQRSINVGYSKDYDPRLPHGSQPICRDMLVVEMQTPDGHLQSCSHAELQIQAFDEGWQISIFHEDSYITIRLDDDAEISLRNHDLKGRKQILQPSRS